MRTMRLGILFLISPLLLAQTPEPGITVIAEAYVEAVTDTM